MNQTEKNLPHTTIPGEIQTLLDHSPKLASVWESLTDIARNEWICFVTTGKKAETRERHLERFEQDLLKGKRRPCCWAGCPHR